MPLSCSRPVIRLGGFHHVREAAPEDWLVVANRLCLAGELPRRWRDGLEENLRDVRAQLELPCPPILLQEAPVDEHQSAVASLITAARRCIQPSSEGTLEFELVCPAVEMNEGPRLLVIIRERWSRRLH